MHFVKRGPSRKKLQNLWSNFEFAIAAVLVGGFALLLWQKGDVIQREVGLTQLHESMVDSYLKDVDSERRIQKAQVEVENFYHAPEIDDLAALNGEEDEFAKKFSHGVSLDQEGSAESISQDIRLRSETVHQELPDEIIRQRLLQKQQYAEYQQEVERSYVKEFKANARKAGYLVEVDENMVVKRVRRVRPVKDVDKY